MGWAFLKTNPEALFQNVALTPLLYQFILSLHDIVLIKLPQPN